jgi:hypothetical protein
MEGVVFRLKSTIQFFNEEKPKVNTENSPKETETYPLKRPKLIWIHKRTYRAIQIDVFVIFYTVGSVKKFRSILICVM